MLVYPLPDRTYLKKRLLVPDQGAAEFQTAGIRRYAGELKDGFNAERKPEDFLEMGSIVVYRTYWKTPIRLEL